MEFTNPEIAVSTASNYDPRTHKITMVGRLSIITFLHEFAHSQGKDETGAVNWSLSLFKRVFPRAFAKLIADHHLLVVPAARTANVLASVSPEQVISIPCPAL